ncbi:sigma-70 family RNA polymerase sigma factor [Sphingorhabdus arenilitoris]|uniref:Sigma-70 family RNA polymerase sigma factor n=1 Tax=Sphingorhabdus arenilitoris TaxID=1490041 RepID=A0ABV8RG06_9SPHN
MSDRNMINVASLAARRADAERDALTDALLRTGQGDKNAFEFVYKQTSAKLFGVCLRIFPDRQEAEEALQDAFINIWNRAARFEKGRASPISWLVTVTRNRAIDRLRAQGKARYEPVETIANLADDAPLPDAVIAADDADGALHNCIETLSGKDAGFIRSAFIRGSTYAQLAAHEKLPLATVKSRIRRALIKLRKCLEGQS